MTDRTERITAAFTEHYMDINAMSIEISESDWPDGFSDNLRAPLGFTSPEPNGRGEWVAGFCVPVIQNLTANLDDDDFDDCLTAMFFCIDYEVTLHNKGLAHDHARRVAITDERMAEEAPGSLRLLTQIQMDWLDRQVH